jgi:hypothetical protein
LATIELAEGDYQAALARHRQAERLASEIGRRYAATEALIGLAAAHHRLGQQVPAQARAQEALAQARAAGYWILEGRALTILAVIQSAQDTVLALGSAAQALALHEQTGHRPGAVQVHLLLGHLSTHPEAARRHWRLALAIATAIGIPEADEAAALLAQS